VLPWRSGHTPAHSSHRPGEGCGAAWSLAWIRRVVGAARVGRCPATYAEAKRSAEVEEWWRECGSSELVASPFSQKGVSSS
jgi:hypothetical protein